MADRQERNSRGYLICRSFEELADDASMCVCGTPALTHTLVEPDPEPDEADRLARLLAGIYSRSGWDSIMAAEKAVYRRDAAAVLADLRERYILVPRDGAEEARELASPSVTLSPEGYAEYAEDMGAEARPMPRSRAVVYGPWQSDAEAVPDLMAALHASVVRARAARNGEPVP